MNISLPAELEQLVQDKVESGRYPSANEVIQEGLRLLDERDRLAEKRLVALKQKIQVGIAELDRGEGIDGEAVFAELEAEIQEAETQIEQNWEAKA